MKSKTGNKRELTGSKSEINTVFVAQKLEEISSSIPEAAVRRHDEKCPPKKSKTGPCADAAQGPVFSRLYKIPGIHGCRKIPDIYSFVTMGMIMGLRLVVL